MKLAAAFFAGLFLGSCLAMIRYLDRARRRPVTNPDGSRVITWPASIVWRDLENVDSV